MENIYVAYHIWVVKCPMFHLVYRKWCWGQQEWNQPHSCTEPQYGNRLCSMCSQ
ncbi:hypothetical protein DPMN_114341 [Dreissena polymorpha]|uniref:Uncharacterized protein n=1 Tax=Dreissena polymorpha TaxID=45954 RepID=A0A9D4QRX1_DREPO|nr:hypothetical protein DPMN_114341 [Dreissena polymorpha]